MQFDFAMYTREITKFARLDLPRKKALGVVALSAHQVAAIDALISEKTN